MATKRSPVWKFFEEDNPKHAICKICLVKLSRGGAGKKAGTSSLKNHLRSKHVDQFTLVFGSLSSSDTREPVNVGFVRSTIAKPMPSSASSNSIQLIIPETTQRKKLWSIHDTRSKEYHYLIGEMIALDNEPVSLVERVGFKRLMQKAVPRYKLPSRTFMMDNIITDIYDRINKKIRVKISKSVAISITSNTWTSDHNGISFISLTAHWLSPDFKLEHAVLRMKPFPGSYTGENIAQELYITAACWNVPLNKTHIILHGGEANIVKDGVVGDYKTTCCFIYSIQRAVSKSFESQADLMEMLTDARILVKHFTHSVLAQEMLRAIQNKLKLPEHQLVQDISTRWNSTYYLQERLLEQKQAISLCIEDYTQINNLTEQQWNLMEEFIFLLKPFEEIIKVTSSGLSCISEVIPHVATLLRYLEKEETARNVPNLLVCLASLKSEIEGYFAELEENQNYLLATLLDPRFKSSFFGMSQAKNARQIILLEGLKMTCSIKESNSSGEDSPPPSKRKATQESFWECFNEVAKDNDENEEKPMNYIASELEFYLKTVRIDRQNDPYVWWSANANQYPILKRLAKIHLSSPCSSIYRERLFSEAGLSYENKRNLPFANITENEKLVFIHHNLPLVNYEY